MRQLYDAQPVQTALIFENRIGLLEASTLAGVLPVVPWRDPLVVPQTGGVLFNIESGERSLIEKASAGSGFGLVTLMNLRV